MRVQNYGFNHPKDDEKWKRVNAVFPWIAALDSFDFGDPLPLDTLLSGESPLPPELRLSLADIISGRRKPNLKAAAKLKIPAANRMQIAAGCSILLVFTICFRLGQFANTPCRTGQQL